MTQVGTAICDLSAGLSPRGDEVTGEQLIIRVIRQLSAGADFFQLRAQIFVALTVEFAPWHHAVKYIPPRLEADFVEVGERLVLVPVRGLKVRLIRDVRAVVDDDADVIA